MILDLFDTHLHLDDEAFAADGDAALARARAAGVLGFVTVGTSIDSCRRAVALAERHDDVHAAVAIHPHNAGDATPGALDELASLARHPRVVAVGETGLDFYRNFAPRDAQASTFRAHLDLSRELDLPVIIHNRDAHN
ncbi:MAG: TatD family hydrolase, partial [bacterium]